MSEIRIGAFTISEVHVELVRSCYMLIGKVWDLESNITKIQHLFEGYWP